MWRERIGCTRLWFREGIFRPGREAGWDATDVVTDDNRDPEEHDEEVREDRDDDDEGFEAVGIENEGWADGGKDLCGGSIDASVEELEGEEEDFVCIEGGDEDASGDL